MSFVQPLILAALPLIALPILIHLINQWRYQTKDWGAMKFLLQANKMNRGFAKIRQWLILAMRTLAVAGLILAVARPLSSGLLGLTGGGRTDTTMVILDRSPSMQQASQLGVSKLETARRQIGDALAKLKSSHWVAIDSTSAEPQSFDSLDAMLESPALTESSATSDLPSLMQSALEYLKSNKPGPTEVWIVSDMRQSDWNDDSGTWSLIREGFQALPQAVRFNLLAYPSSDSANISLRVTEAKRAPAADDATDSEALLLSLQLSRSVDATDGSTESEIPIQVEVNGARTEFTATLSGAQTEIRNHRIALPRDQLTGWGKVSIPADTNAADNTHYFVYADEPVRRIVVVSEDRNATRALEIAAGISASGETNSNVEVLTPDQVDSIVLDDAALLLWQSALPDASMAPAIDAYIKSGGQVVFFPPSQLTTGVGAGGQASYAGVSWDTWQTDQKVMVENWRGDQDLLAATDSGVGLPVGQLELQGFATLKTNGELSKLATLTGGAPLLSRVPTDRGGVYFFSASADPKASTLAESGIVLFVAVQRAIERGQEALGNTTSRIASKTDMPTDDWRQVLGDPEVLSTEFPVHSGVYKAGEQLFAVNRSPQEDQRDLVPDAQVESLFEGLQFSRVDDVAGSLSGIVREVWRLFLVFMILALLLEAALCIPRRVQRRDFRSPNDLGFGSTRGDAGASTTRADAKNTSTASGSSVASGSGAKGGFSNEQSSNSGDTRPLAGSTQHSG